MLQVFCTLHFKFQISQEDLNSLSLLISRRINFAESTTFSVNILEIMKLILVLACIPALIQADFAWSYKCGDDSVCKRVPLAGIQIPTTFNFHCLKLDSGRLKIYSESTCAAHDLLLTNN